MKKIIIVVALAILSCSQLLAQSPLYDRLSEKDGITAIYMPMKWISKYANTSVKISCNDKIDIAKFSKHIETMIVLNAEETTPIQLLKAEEKRVLSDKSYSLMMKIKDDELVSVFVKSVDDVKVSEIIMFVDEKNEFSIIQLLGKMTMSEIEAAVK